MRRIVRNISAALHYGLRGKNCEAAATELRLNCAEADVLTYPDIVVFCGPHDSSISGKTRSSMQRSSSKCSLSTSSFDRNEKFSYYKTLPSFVQYLLFGQKEPRAELYTRGNDGQWTIRKFRDRSNPIILEYIGCELNLDELYERVEFDIQD